MPGIVDDLVTPELTRMVSHHLVVEQHYDTLGMRAHEHHPPGCPGVDTIPVMIRHDQAGGGGTHPPPSPAFSSARLFTRGLGRNSRSRRLPTWFSTCPFSHPEAGVQATGSIRWCEHICRKRRLYWRALPTEDRLNRRLHVVVDAAPADTVIEHERLVMSVKPQLLGLAEVGAHERHPAVRQLHV